MAYFRKLPSGNWSAQIDTKGVRTSQTFRTKALAQAWATRVEQEIAAKERGVLIRRSLRQALEAYADAAPRQRDKVRCAFLAESLGFADKWLEDVQPAHFAAWRDRQLLALKPSSVNRDLNLLGSVLSRAIEAGWLHKSPLSKFKRPKDPAPRNRLITWREVRAVLRALDWHARPPETLQQQVGYAFLISLHTAMRAGEVLSFELRGNIAHLPKTKNGDPRDVPLSRRAIKLIKLCGPLTVTGPSLDALFRKARLKAGLSGFVMHDARATALTRLASKVDAFTLQRISGHRDLSILANHYYRKSPSEIAAGLR